MILSKTLSKKVHWNKNIMSTYSYGVLDSDHKMFFKC